MRKAQIVKGIVIVVTAAVLVACKHGGSNIPTTGGGLNRSLYGQGDSIHCDTPPTNCFDDVIVTGVQASTYRRFNEAVDSNTTTAFFSGEEWKSLFPNLGKFPKQLEMLRNGLPLLRFESHADGVVHYLATRQSREQILDQTHGQSRRLIKGVEFGLSVRQKP
jgi:hypothetical protein